MFYGPSATVWFKNDQNWLKNKEVTLHNKLKELFFPVFSIKIAACLSGKKLNF
jgi:hypothetical protein